MDNYLRMDDVLGAYEEIKKYKHINLYIVPNEEYATLESFRNYLRDMEYEEDEELDSYTKDYFTIYFSEPDDMKNVVVVKTTTRLELRVFIVKFIKVTELLQENPVYVVNKIDGMFKVRTINGCYLDQYLYHKEEIERGFVFRTLLEATKFCYDKNKSEENGNEA